MYRRATESLGAMREAATRRKRDDPVGLRGPDAEVDPTRVSRSKILAWHRGQPRGAEVDGQGTLLVGGVLPSGGWE